LALPTTNLLLILKNPRKALSFHHSKLVTREIIVDM